MLPALSRRALLKTAAGTVVISPWAAALAQSQELIINGYGGSWETFWRNTVLPGFEKATGITTKYDSGLARTWTANLRAAGPPSRLNPSS
jgi:putative spermidine/putrescine transport system substrate-binding protein